MSHLVTAHLCVCRLLHQAPSCCRRWQGEDALTTPTRAGKGQPGTQPGKPQGAPGGDAWAFLN